MNYKKILVIGDNDKAPYHTMNKIQEQLYTILKDEFILIFNDQYDNLTLADLESYELVISYIDCWNMEINNKLAVSIISYISNGGGLLAIHNGISLQNNKELAHIIGAEFTMHPERDTLIYTDINENHPIMKDIGEFQLWEEPYQFDFDPFTEKEILFYYQSGDYKVPAAWTTKFGLGKVIYLSPGHEKKSFENQTFAQIIRNCASWLRVTHP